MPSSIYTAISFAPVQGFIERSRKLRDLFGASLLLSHLSDRLIEWTTEQVGEENLISPAMINHQKGTPNRILVKGHLKRNDIANELMKAWQNVLDTCENWIQDEVPAAIDYGWKEEWNHWKRYAWEVFWGQGESAIEAMRDLETRKLQRDWVGINWLGESSSLSGADAIVYPGLGTIAMKPGNTVTKADYTSFYRQLAWSIEHPGEFVPDSAEDDAISKFIDPSERLSIPELTKRLITLPKLARRLKIEFPEKFNDTSREPGEWTGWFMADGDRMGEHLQKLSQQADSDTALKDFSRSMREWGKDFEAEFPRDLGRVIYAGGDDFLGAIYAEADRSSITTQKVLDWLYAMPEQWATHKQPITVSMGFVWAGHGVPQRDILQHCREAEKRSKSFGRDRLTLRVVFNSGQFVQWTCPWKYLQILQLYRDRDGKQNWVHLYNDWAHLKARHTVSIGKDSENADDRIALSLIDRYFDFEKQHQKAYGMSMKDYLTHGYQDCYDQPIAGRDDPKALIEWIDGLIQVGWQLCSNS